MSFNFKKKWLIRILIAFLTACFSAGVSLTFPKLVTGENSSHPRIRNYELSATNSPQLLQQGAALFQAEQFDQAITVLQQALTAFKAAKDKFNQAQAQQLLSLAYQQLGKWQEAKEAINYSLSVIRSLPINKNTQLIYAKALNSQGHLQLASGQSEAALNSWKEAAVKYQQVGDIEGTIGSQINQAPALQSLGLYREAKKTLSELEKYLKNQPSSLIKSTGLRSLGNALRVIGDLESSRKLLEESLSIAEEVRSPTAISAAYFSLANTTRALAQKTTEIDEQSNTITPLEIAIKLYEKSAETSTSPIRRSLAKINQFSLLVNSQKFTQASSLLKQINLNQLSPSRRTIYAQINLAESLIRYKQNIKSFFSLEALKPDCKENQNNNDSPNNITIAKDQTAPHIVSDLDTIDQVSWLEIGRILATAVEQSRSLKDQQAESYSLGKLAELYALTGQSQESLKLTQQALVLAQAVNAADISYRWQWKLGQQLKAKDDIKGAIAAYNTAVETLKSIRGDLVALNPDNQDVQFSFRASVEPVYRELVELLVSTEGEPSQENLRQARQVIESLQLAELDNFFQEACLDAKPVQIDQIDPTAAIVYPLILPDRLAVIVSLPQKELPLRYYVTPKPKCEIESVLNNLQQNIGLLSANNDEILQLSQQVYDWIIRPAETDIKNSKIKTLVFVLDGLLRNIPMAALHDGKKYLIEKYSIALTPGLQLLPPQPLKKEQFRALTAGISAENQGLLPLPGVEKELQEIKSQVSGVQLLNQQFTNQNLQQALSSVAFPVVHIATHGQFSSQADETYIVTWGSRINVKDLDNLLRVREEKVERPIELLVFSACETARGDNRATLGLAGVAIRAGARSTLATLWRVSDDSTATLMAEFYRELASSKTKAEALRQAQIKVLHDNKYNIPYYWAPYVLVGNWN